MAGKPTVASLAQDIAAIQEAVGTLAQVVVSQAEQPAPTAKDKRKQTTAQVEAVTPVVKLATGAQAFVAIASKGGKDKVSKRYGDGPRVRITRVNGRGAAYAEATLRRDTLEALWALTKAEREALVTAMDEASPAWEAMAEQAS